MPTVARHPPPTTAASERRLLSLFAPTRVDRPVDGGERGRDLTALWRADAIHRAKNLAQLAIALGVVVDGVAGAPAARALARAYETLALDNHSNVRVPCIDLMTTVATGLGVMFGRARNIDVQVSGVEIFVPAEHRRALTLMCSELVINALKYAFPAGGPGTVAVTIGPHPLGIELVVADDGVGVTDTGEATGQGDGLLARLAHVIGGTLRRSPGADGTGLRVGIVVALPAIMGRVAS